MKENEKGIESFFVLKFQNLLSLVFGVFFGNTECFRVLGI